MISCYEIIKTDLDIYSAIVFSVTYVNPIDQIEEIERELEKSNMSGKVLIDLLLSHGNTPDRFYEAFFNGKTFIDHTLKITKPLSKKLIDISLDFYHKRQHYLEQSVLSKAQKFLIKKNKPLKTVYV